MKELRIWQFITSVLGFVSRCGSLNRLFCNSVMTIMKWIFWAITVCEL